MKRTIFLLALLLAVLPAAADEGMWLVNRLERVYPEMRREGLKLKLDEIFSAEHPALCDAVAAIDGGVGTGSMISEQGLLITNHHVAYSDICALSTPEHNWLEEGFWARTRAEELPVAGKTVSFLRDVEEVTAEARALRDEWTAAGRWGMMSSRKLASELERRHAREGLEASCVAMWGGEVYLLFFYEVYTDVRLVGAPPARIGAFGGETDNWGWPQHKGDFALYRVYGDAEGRPAKYAPENKPIRPRRVLSVSTRGVRERDFTMILGFPGITHRYGSSFAAAEKFAKNPVVELCRHERMEIIRRRMEADPAVRMAYSDAYFGLSNYADYACWENICLARYDVVARRAAEERELAAWVASDGKTRERYGSLLDELKRGYEARREAVMTRTWFQESWLGPTRSLLVANRLASSLARLERRGADSLRPGMKVVENMRFGVNQLERNYDAATDRELLVALTCRFMEQVPRDFWGEGLQAAYDRYGGDVARMAGDAFDRSFCRDAELLRRFLDEPHSLDELRRDPLVALAYSVGFQRFAAAVRDAEQRAGVDVGRAEARFREAQYAWREATGRAQYPDANSTLRLTYGRVCPLAPRDGVLYDFCSTVKGYEEKADSTNYDFRVDGRMRSLIAARDWGRWGEGGEGGEKGGGGELRVDFLSDNDITGGNSGSPVLNGRGELVGLAFDGNRESMAGDLWFHPEQSRTVSVDIRYVMWVIEKYAGAGCLLDEIRFVR